MISIFGELSDNCQEYGQSQFPAFVLYLTDLSSIKYKVWSNIVMVIAQGEQCEDFGNPLDLSFVDCGY